MNRDKWRSNRIIRTIIFRCRSFMEKRSFSRGRNNKILNKGVRVTSRIQIDGEDNVVFCENRSVLYNCLVKIKGRGNRIILREGAYLSGVELFVQDNECTIEIGKNTFVGHHTHLACTEDGSILQIGDNCMLSSYVQLRTGDSHSILNADGNRINQASNVIIGNHCWLGEGCKVLWERML